MYLKIAILMLFVASSHAFAQTGSQSLTRECDLSKNEWIWCEDFEVDRQSEYFEGSANRESSIGVNGSTAARFTFQPGSNNGGNIKIAFGVTPNSYFKPVDSGTRKYKEIYWRMYVFVPTGWVGNGADKLSRATVMAGDNWSQAMIAHVWSGADPGSRAEYLYIDPASGTDINGSLITTTYNDFGNLRWLGSKSSESKVFSINQFGKWQCIEARAKLNAPGASDGVFQLFVDGELEVERVQLNWVGNYQEYGINAVYFENWWGAGSPVTQSRFFDNLVISTEKIGCGDESSQKPLSPPMPPTNIIIKKRY